MPDEQTILSVIVVLQMQRLISLLKGTRVDFASVRAGVNRLLGHFKLDPIKLPAPRKVARKATESEA